MTDFEVDITPSVTTYELYQIASYTPWFALGEFIDNSITSAIQNWDALSRAASAPYSLDIRITLDREDSRIVIEDNAGGIRASDIQRALTAGDRPPDPSLLSVHGVGMKMSAFWWGRRLTLETWPIGSPMGFKAVVDLDAIRESKSAMVQVEEIPLRGYSGTRLTIDKVGDSRWPRGRALGKLRVLLASMYRLYLNSREHPLNLTLDDQELVYAEPALLEEPFWPDTRGPGTGDSVLWEAEFDFTTTRGNRIYGFVGLLARMSRDVSGFFLHYKGKGMGGIGTANSGDGEFSTSHLRDSREYYRPAAIFGQEGGYRYQRFTGEFDISDFGKTSSTDSIPWDLEEEIEFLDALKSFLRRAEMNFWAMAENYQPRAAVRRRDLEEGARQSDEDSLPRLEAEVDEVDRALKSIVVQHDSEPSSPETESARALVRPLDSLAVEAGNISFKDSAGHTHTCAIQYVDDPILEMLQVESSSSDCHVLLINTGHPYLRTFQWSNPAVRTAIRSILIFLGLSEVLLPLRVSPDALRRKLNEIIDAAPQIQGLVEDD